MYVCLCNAYRERDIAAAARAGARTPEAAYAWLGAAPVCGRCLPMAQSVIDPLLSSPRQQAEPAS
jgi:bacterioferritin-associated ferredoxin